ncbi:prophage LambdaCh01 DNA binding domain-containing protein [Bacillus methanolicus PB1]|uniref:Prophage LambdaCh01 DNA binding domain-containing protein n=1 Tax=Bacillus methanolicus PB1 TaxID=997296 RepID=I3E5K3_BACMT|nr:helix-turn-helix domain-containing protein [Bacillus methanolicus]EIJ81774.1 prophage LambdaCh01 DNA binding domain-containing protein [Bacillus methanolicus PB1]
MAKKIYTSEEDIPFVLTAEDIRDILGIGTTSAYELLNSGEFHTVRVGKQIRVSKKVFLDWLYSSKEVAS